MKILIVDDNADDRKILRLNLEHRDIEVVEAQNGQEGLELAAIRKPDLIVSDALMPVMDGFQFLRNIKTDESLRSIPFIFYSATYTGYQEVALATSLGAEAFVIKPKEPEEFWEELVGILEECKLNKAKTLTAELIEEEEVFLKKYSHIVAAKLEEKVRELEKAKDCIKESEKRYRELFDTTLDGVYRTDEHNTFTMINKAGSGIFGFESPEEMIGASVLDRWIDAKDRELFLQKLRLERSISSYPVKAKKKNGEIIFLEITSHIIEDEHGKYLGIEGIIRDVTAHKRLEEQLRQAQKMEAIGQLAGGVAHDFNNILSAIIGYASLTLMNMGDDDPLKTNIDQILNASQRATTLTQSLLAFSRKQVVNLAGIDLNELIQRFEKFLLRILREDIELKIHCSEEALSVMADSGQIEQVLMNFATNARDAMPDGGRLTIETGALNLNEEFVEVHGYGKPGEFALITVSDTGTGMDAKTREKIFEPFFTTKEEGKGTGLGLAMVYGIVKQHDGFINVYSEPGQGTTFRIYLPIAVAAAIAEGIEEAEPVAVRGGTETILIAEDDPALRKLTSTVLGHYGYTVIESVDGEDAIIKFIENKDRIQLVLLDGIMPKKNGKQAYDEIKIISPDVRAMFMSGYSEDVFSAKSIMDKGLTYILKPISPSALGRKVREVLDKKK